MGILMWLLAGLVVGAVAKWIVPGKDPGGLLATIGLGIAGAFLGGMVSSAIGLGGLSGPNVPSFVIAVLGAIALLVVTKKLMGRAA